MASSQKSLHEALRSCLIDVGQELTDIEAGDLAFEVMEHRADAEKIKSGRDFVQAMETIQFVTPRNVDKLLSLLKRRNHMKAHCLLLDYKTNCSYGSSSVYDDAAENSSKHSGKVLNYIEESSKKCETHQKYERDNYCLTCRTYICLKCILEAHNESSHDVFPLDDLPQKIEQLEGEMGKSFKYIDDLYSSVEEVHNRRTQLDEVVKDIIKKEIDTSANATIETIKANRKALQETVESKDRLEKMRSAKMMENVKRKYMDVNLLRSCNQENGNPSLDKLQKIGENLGKIETVSFALHKFLKLEDNKVKISSHQVENNGIFCKITTGKLVGGVMIKKEQCVHLIDQRAQEKKVLLICFDPMNSKEEQWKYSYHVADQESPVALSSRAMYHKLHFRLLFAVGKTVYVVDFNSDDGFYKSVNSIEFLDIDVVREGSWISCIYAHHNTTNHRSEFLIAVSGSTIIHQCNLIDRRSVASIDTSQMMASSDDLSSITYNESTYAIVCNDSNEVILFTQDGKLKRSGALSPPASVTPLRPHSVFWTGARWLVVWIGREMVGPWWVLMYKPKEDRMESVYRGEVTSLLDIPVSITNSERNVIVSLANTSVVVFNY